MVTTKTCTDCGITYDKPAEHFSPNASSLGGLTNRCKSCQSDAVERMRYYGTSAAAKLGPRRVAYDRVLERVRAGLVANDWVDALLATQRQLNDYERRNPRRGLTVISDGLAVSL